MFGLGAWQAVSMVLFSALQHFSGAQWRSTFVRLPAGLGLVPLNGLLAGGAGGAVCATWAAWHNAVWSWPLQVRCRALLGAGRKAGARAGLHRDATRSLRLT